MQIITNNQPRELVCLADLPDRDRADFDYIDGDDQFTDRMVRYKGAWYDLSEFVRIVKRSREHIGWGHGVDDDSPLLAWDGIATDSYFSATVCRYAADGERVIMGRVYS